MKTMRETTLQTLGLGTVLDIFKNGRLPVDEAELVDKVFGPANNRGSLVISGGNGIVGSGKAMQLGSRLLKHNIPIVTLDLPDAPDGIGKQYPGLKRSFGQKPASAIMANIIRLSYDGASLPPSLKSLKPKFVLEAIPEILDLKRAHYAMLRANFPGIEIRSVTSGFPSAELGVGILHPSFPHEINKMWEVIEERPSDITKLLLALGLIPIPMGDYWSFVLDVLFCGITLAATRFNQASNMPFWKIDKYIRKLVGPNPLRAHDVIGPGASFLSWSCLQHLSEKYGEVFKPTPELIRRRYSGESWYSSNRPIVDWRLDDEAEFESWILGPLFQMTSLLLYEKRAHLSYINAIGEICAQFTKGILAFIRNYGIDNAIKRVEDYHKKHPQAAKSCWFPETFAQISGSDGQQLYVNAEYEGDIGVISISRESLNWDVVRELNRAIDRLKTAGVKKVILTGDFHLSTQMVGADTTEFFPALEHAEEGFRVAKSWAETARKFHDDFELTVGFINGKRCLGGMLELMMHCHYLISLDSAQLGMPEVTLPVVPGMEGCHWPFRKVDVKQYPKLFELLLSGNFYPAKETIGWLIDYAGNLDEALKKVWLLVNDKECGIPLRKVNREALAIPPALPTPLPSGKAGSEGARKTIYDCIIASCGTTLAQALELQAKHSAGFMITDLCHKGEIGKSYKKSMDV